MSTRKNRMQPDQQSRHYDGNRAPQNYEGDDRVRRNPNTSRPPSKNKKVIPNKGA